MTVLRLICVESRAPCVSASHCTHRRSASMHVATGATHAAGSRPGCKEMTTAMPSSLHAWAEAVKAERAHSQHRTKRRSGSREAAQTRRAQKLNRLFTAMRRGVKLCWRWAQRPQGCCGRRDCGVGVRPGAGGRAGAALRLRCSSFSFALGCLRGVV